MHRLAIIPARGGSKRLPRKNVAQLGNRPMIAHVIATAREAGLFDRVVVSTEDAGIGEVAGKAGAEVVWRPDELSTDQATVVQVCADLLGQIVETPECFCCIYATAAFLDPSDLVESEALLEEADVAKGVSEYPMHPYKALEVSSNGFLRPKWPTQYYKKTQEYPDLVAGNGTFNWVRTEGFLREPTFNPERVKGFKLPPERSVDIDTPEDLDWARKLWSLRGAGKAVNDTSQ